MDSVHLFDAFAQNFVGVRTPVRVRREDGSTGTVPRAYLDSAATCLMPRAVWRTVERYLVTSCANSHTQASSQGRDTTNALHRAHEILGEFVGYASDTDCVIFTGSGATGPMNLLASAIIRDRSRPLVVVSQQEHHSNMLPWIRAAGRSNVRYIRTNDDGEIDMAALGQLLSREGRRIAVVAVTALSNVTGVINPIYDIARLTHAAGAQIVVDAAQAAAHIPIDMHSARGADIDFVVMSGHKLYAPGSPGVLVGRRAVFENAGWNLGPVGGGVVDFVDFDTTTFKRDPSERMEAGTPNIPGTIALGAAVTILRAITMPIVATHEADIVSYAFSQISQVPGIVIYGPTDPSKRAALVAFNVGSMPHGLVAAALNDYAGIAVRNDCFCAQPYVRQQIFSACERRGYCEPMTVERRGMVRASFGVYTTHDDIDRLVGCLDWIAANETRLNSEYMRGEDGTYTSNVFQASGGFDLETIALTELSATSDVPAMSVVAAAGRAITRALVPAWR